MMNIISVSGGKDSTALLALAVVLDVPNMLAVFADTGHEHELTYQYIDYLSDWLVGQGHPPIRTVRADFSAEINRKRQQLLDYANGIPGYRHGRGDRHTPESALQMASALVPTGNPFADLCILKGRFPSAKVRFCTQRLKRDPLFEQVFIPLMDGRMILSWQGVRADESSARKYLPECDEVGGGLFNYRPILRWRVSDVFDAIQFVGLEPNPLYKMGMKRVGCMPCINCTKDELLEIGKRFPGHISRVAEMEAKVAAASKHGSATFFTSDERGHGVEEVVVWAKTSRGLKNLDMFRVLDSDACSSAYGLCE